MIYPENLSPVELAVHYSKYKDVKCLEELDARDKLSKMTYNGIEEPDNQMDFDFHKDLVSEPEATNNISVKDDPWKEVYEAGFRAGGKYGLKIAETMKVPGVSEEENEKS